MRVMAGFDFASLTGWAVGGGDMPRIDYGVWDLRPKTGESPGMRYVRLVAHLAELYKSYPDLVLICYEEAHHRGAAATQYAHGYIAHVQAWCAAHGIEHTSVHSGTLKKWATGSGRASKDDMIAKGREHFNLPDDVTDDEVDALWVLDYTRGTYA